MAKKVNVNYNPMNTAAMSEREMRKVYAELRKTANKRMKRMINEGFGDYALAKIKFPMTKELESKEEVRNALLNVSSYLREPRTTLRTLKKIEAKTVSTLESHGYEIPKSKLSDFGDYMDAMRQRYKNRLMPPSNLIADTWEQAARVGMSGKTLMRKFKEWLDDRDEMEKMHDILEEYELPKNRKRLSSTELLEMLGE